MVGIYKPSWTRSRTLHAKIAALFAGILLATAAHASASCALTTAERAQLRSAVAHTHATWGAVRGSLEQYIVSESIAAGYSPMDEIGVLQRLLDAGFDVHDAQVIGRVLSELARAHDLGPRGALGILLAAIHHHGQRLAALEPRLRPILARNGKLSELLAAIHRDDSCALQPEAGTIQLDRARVIAELDCS